MIFRSEYWLGRVVISLASRIDPRAPIGRVIVGTGIEPAFGFNVDPNEPASADKRIVWLRSASLSSRPTERYVSLAEMREGKQCWYSRGGKDIDHDPDKDDNH